MSRRGGGGGGYGRETTSVYVRNLHHECRQDDLHKIFSKYGEVTDVYIPLDYHTRQPRGFAYIQFTHLEDAEDSVYYIDGTSLFGRALEVQVAQSDRKTPSQMRYRGGRRHRGRGRSRSPRVSRSKSASTPPRRSASPADRRSASKSKSKSRSKSRSKSK